MIKPINLQLVVMIAVRKALDKVFTSSELKILDDILPHFTRHERLDDEASHLRVLGLFHNCLNLIFKVFNNK